MMIRCLLKVCQRFSEERFELSDQKQPLGVQPIKVQKCCHGLKISITIFNVKPQIKAFYLLVLGPSFSIKLKSRLHSVVYSFV